MKENGLNPHSIVRYLSKPSADFTKQDLVKFMVNNHVQMLNFHYVGGDSKLKTLNFAFNSRAQLDQILSAGERVDGSSLFPYIDAASSDLYVIPRYRTAFVNPFSDIPAVDILCSYYTSKGEPLPSAPEFITARANQALKSATGLEMEAMGELEYYILYNQDPLYPNDAQRGYHASTPFAKWEHLRVEASHILAAMGCSIKYSHAEVGHIPSDEMEMEQHEIEFLPVNIESAADQIVLAKWVLRTLGYKYGVTISFAPKLLVGHAGSGLHIHTRLVKNGRNMMVQDGELSDTAHKVIAGYLKMASSLTAFGNTVPVSYLRLVPKHEAPTNICWGDRNRSVLVRVPLGWRNKRDMARNANPREKTKSLSKGDSQTVEFRCPDGSANAHLLMAGLASAARHGLQMPGALSLAKKLYVDVNIFHDEFKKIQKTLPQLPLSCWQSADCLVRDRAVYEKDSVFSHKVIDGIARNLKNYNDRDLSRKLYGQPAKIKDLINRHLHCS
ncbi:MAG TPA: glutamine synthetase family protein [Planctomycetota bacterium]|nr:glutamine synthetase family protein [Planctomycetota bacterium]